VKLVLGKDFPQGPPKAYFLTKIFHPNVAKNGEICVNTLKKDWKPDLGIQHILLASHWNSMYIINVYVYILFFIFLDCKMSTDSAKSRICFKRGSWKIAFRKS